MIDIVDTSTRSRIMASIKGRDTKPEILIRKLLHKRGFRFRLHVKELPGKPDVVLKKYKAVIFINGCFWHGHKDCHLFKLPATRTDFWEEKINKNQLNDTKTIKLLLDNDWRVCVVWECS
ncbi:DNA mismatch endonuclease Vsr, partial [Acinetobacter baumannii]|nr:DNA mismatch endonuclease Vsr [Acinetobacter baumannii]